MADLQRGYRLKLNDSSVISHAVLRVVITVGILVLVLQDEILDSDLL